MGNYTVFESVNMGSTRYAERIFDAISEKDIENGTFGYLDGLAEGESNVYKFVAGTKVGETIVVTDNPAWTEDTSRTANQRKDKYIIPAGVRFRVRVIKKNDEFGISIEGITAATQAVINEVTDFTTTDIFVTVDETTGKLVAATESVEGAVMEAKIERKRIVGGALVTDVNKYGYSKAIYEARVVTLA